MLDAFLANSRHFPAINWMQSYSLYEKTLVEHFTKNVDKNWAAMRNTCREILRQEESLKEIMEIVGIDGLQEQDKLIMTVAENIRTGFLAQNAYSEDAFCLPEKTLEMISRFTDQYLKQKPS